MSKPGMNLEKLEKECGDKYCPFHGELSVRGQILEGKVVSKPDPKTVVVERERARRIPKYERYEKRRSSISAHVSPCLEVEVGDQVKIGSCRKISKTKSFVTLEVTE